MFSYWRSWCLRAAHLNPALHQAHRLPLDPCARDDSAVCHDCPGRVNDVMCAGDACASSCCPVTPEHQCRRILEKTENYYELQLHTGTQSLYNMQYICWETHAKTNLLPPSSSSQRLPWWPLLLLPCQSWSILRKNTQKSLTMSVSNLHIHIHRKIYFCCVGFLHSSKKLKLGSMNKWWKNFQFRPNNTFNSVNYFNEWNIFAYST